MENIIGKKVEYQETECIDGKMVLIEPNPIGTILDKVTVNGNRTRYLVVDKNNGTTLVMPVSILKIL